MSEKKKDQAIRLFEALGGVDPELLARSEKQKQVVPFRRFVRMAAACLVLLMVGGLSWHVIRTTGGADESGMAGMAIKEDSLANGSQSAISGKPKDFVGEDAFDSANYCVDEACESYSGIAEENGDAQEMHDDGSQLQKADGTVSPTWLPELEGARTDQEEEVLAYGAKGLAMADEETKLYFADKRMEIRLGDQEPVRLENQAEALGLYAILRGLRLETVQDQSFEAYVVIYVYDAGDNMADSYCVSGNYVKLMGLPDTYEVLDEEFVYEAFYAELQEITEEQAE